MQPFLTAHCVRCHGDKKQKGAFRVGTAQAAPEKLTVTGAMAERHADAKAAIYQIGPATRLWNGRGLGALADQAPGESILPNPTACTLKGPGRCTDIRIDDESRQIVEAPSGPLRLGSGVCGSTSSRKSCAWTNCPKKSGCTGGPRYTA